MFQTTIHTQRVLIALEEAGAEYTLYRIDMSNKPEWYFKINPLGKVRPITSLISTSASS